MNINKTAQAISESNVDALKTASILTASNVLLTQVTKLINKNFPDQYKSYVDNPFAKILIANIFAHILLTYKRDDQKLKIISEAMMTTSYIELINIIDINSFISEFLETKEISDVLKSIEV